MNSSAYKILVTGGAGFIGFHLAKLMLGAGHSVWLVDNFNRGVHDKELELLACNRNVKLVKTDLTNSTWADELPTDFDLIFHLAAIIGVKNVMTAPFRVLRDNNAMLVNALDFASKQRKLKRFIFSSTSEIYAGTLEKFNLEIPTPESSPLALTNLNDARTSYMLSKIYGEALCIHSGIPYTLVRPHNFYGPRMGLSHVIPELLKKVYNSKKDGTLDVFSAEHTRTFCYIDDAVAMIFKASTSDSGAQEAFNVGAAAPEISIASLATTILKVTGRTDLQLNFLPATSGSPTRRCPSMEKTHRLLNIEAGISLEAGIEKTFNWYRPNIFDGNGLSAQ